ncbi:hypothetical protein Gohar_000014, partial [Gossypium harknessii]|nr:hypothetical protein [Gossypium harknessii]
FGFLSGAEANPLGDPNTKKVLFKESTSVLEDEMVVDTMTTPTLPWKDLVLGNKSDGQKVVDEINPLDKDFALQDGDVNKSNGIPSIDFLERIHQLLVEEMATSVVLKKEILWEIGGLIRKVTKLDFNTDNKGRGRYVRMAVYINIDRHLISQVLINGKIQKIEYENLPMVCFSCGRYGHNREVYSNRSPLSAILDVLLQSSGFASTSVEPSTAVEPSTGKENTTRGCWWSENPGANLVNPINLEGLKKGRKSRVQDFNL